jgi:hypothetical protein
LVNRVQAPEAASAEHKSLHGFNNVRVFAKIPGAGARPEMIARGRSRLG